MGEEKHGVKELTEVLAAIVEIGLVLIQKSKDGFDFSDVVSLVGEKDVVAAITAAVEGISEVPDEIKDLDALEGVELAKTVLDYVPRIVESFQKEETVEP